MTAGSVAGGAVVKRGISAGHDEFSVRSGVDAAIGDGFAGGLFDDDAAGAAIDTLPQAQKQAVELLKLRELSLKEAAGVTGMTVGALKVATHRALKSLRRALGAAEDRP